jgi:hypothetical protein
MVAVPLPTAMPITVTEQEPAERVQLLGEKDTMPVPGGTADHVTEPAGVWPPSATVAEQVAVEPTATLFGLQLTVVVVAAAVVVVLLEDDVLVLVVVEPVAVVVPAEVAFDVVDGIVELVEVVDAAVGLVDVVVELVAELNIVELGDVVVVEVKEDVAVDVRVVVLGGPEMRDETPTPTVTNTTVITAMTGTVVIPADRRLFLAFLESLGYS